MFIVSKILWVLLTPANLLVLLLVLGAFLSLSHRESVRVTGRNLNFVIALVLFLIAVTPLSDWALTPLENRFAPMRPDTVDGIIVLGGDENALLTRARGQPVMGDSSSRQTLFAALARQYPDAQLVYTGGSGLMHATADMKEAEVAKANLASLGVRVDSMIFENQSRNTYENAIMTAAIVHPKPQQKWLLVTSAWHMPRAIGCFRKAGWNVYAAPASYQTTGRYSTTLTFEVIQHLGALSQALHEYVGLVSYWLMGRIDSPWPK